MDFYLREVMDIDLPIFYQQQLDPDANFMVAFTSRDPANRKAFDAHWKRVLANETGIVRTIVVMGETAGYVLSYEEEPGKPEVGYWLGKEYWGRGLATQALGEFLENVNTTRPIHARVAKDNLASRRVLEKCGFRVIGKNIGYANARGEEIEELILTLD